MRRKTKRPHFRVVFLLTYPKRWRQSTLPFQVPSTQEGLTAVFGMRTGVALPINHQRFGYVIVFLTENSLVQKRIRKIKEFLQTQIEIVTDVRSFASYHCSRR